MADSMAEAAREMLRGRYPVAGVRLPPRTWGVLFAIVAARVGEKVDEGDWDRGHARRHAELQVRTAPGPRCIGCVGSGTIGVAAGMTIVSVLSGA